MISPVLTGACSVNWDHKLVEREIKNITENCEGCVLKRRTPIKPAAAIPPADGFNQCVAMYLKIHPLSHRHVVKPPADQVREEQKM